ncbi:MAG: 2-C-methyl-D-erythritol 2,4-cyclodiphosphate synthase, partial [Acholeplasmatales bacterium]|nr:2-C-methyl-D-erythritol 2,4-cyclodiphosphate synthase [Acholeplasmatales bacterium]
KEDFVLIHDAARPLITSSLIKNILEIDYNFYNCAVVCKNISNSLFDKQKRTHLDRNNFLSLETPQVFKVTDIKTAYDNIDDNMVFYDDLSVLLNTFPNKSINYFIYNENNLKLTYESDFYLISNLLHGIDNTNYIYKIGYSYDFHKLVKNRKLILGGIEIPSEKGLLGHSDADCLLHAIAESFLGALSLGDLGKYYPDTNIAFLNKDSKEILKEIYNIIISNGFLINNIDCMVHLEKPKLGMYIDKQKLTIASILAIDPSLISIKATTNERVGLVGKEKGIACSVMTLLRKEVKNGN